MRIENASMCIHWYASRPGPHRDAGQNGLKSGQYLDIGTGGIGILQIVCNNELVIYDLLLRV